MRKKTTNRELNRLLEHVTRKAAISDLELRLSATMTSTKAQRSEQILNGLPDGIAVTGLDGVIDFANRALMALLGVDDDGPDVHCTMEGLLGIESSPQAEHAMELLRHTARAIVFELPRGHQTTDGVLRVGRHPVTDTNDGFRDFGLIVRDLLESRNPRNS